MGGNIYIADADDHRVRKIAPSGIISTLAGNGHAGIQRRRRARHPRLNSARPMAWPPIAVATSTSPISETPASGASRRTAPFRPFAGGGTTAPAQADGRAATLIALTSPRNIAVDFYGTVYFSDFGGNRVYQVSASGTLNILAGTGKAGYSGDGSIGWNAQLSSPAGVTVDTSGIVYIADSGNARIRKVYRGVISTLGDGGIPGATPSFTVIMPVGLAMDPDGSLFVADLGGNQVLRVTPALAATPIAQPAADIAIDPQGNLLRVLRRHPVSPAEAGWCDRLGGRRGSGLPG